MDQWIKRAKSAHEHAAAPGAQVSLPFLLAQARPSWREAILRESKQPYFEGLIAQLNATEFYPPPDCILRALSFFDVAETRVVIMGQDPYHGPGQAMGLSFSVNRGVPIPPSLRNIYKEIGNTVGYADGAPKHGSLVGWAAQGVLLLNTTLTVAPARPGSHFGLGWHRLTDRIIAEVNARAPACVFMLWGAEADKISRSIDGARHLVLRSAHPSPLSAMRGFFGGDHFRKANAFLRAHGRGEVAWAES